MTLEENGDRSDNMGRKLEHGHLSTDTIIALALILVIVSVAPCVAETTGDSGIIARWTAIYERFGLTELSDTEFERRLAYDSMLMQKITMAQEEAAAFAERVTDKDAPALIAAFLDSSTCDWVRSDVSHWLMAKEGDSWNAEALALAPDILALVEDSGEHRAYRRFGIEIIASMRYEPAGEVLYRFACDQRVTHDVRCWAIKYFPRLAPQLFDGIPEQYMEFVRQNYSSHWSGGGDTGPELRAWVEAAAYDALNEREIGQLKYLVASNWAGIEHAATQSLLAQSPDTAARAFAAQLREQLLAAPDTYRSEAMRNLMRTGSSLAMPLLQEALIAAVRQHHIADSRAIANTLSTVRETAQQQYPALLAAVDRAIAVEAKAARAARFDPRYPGVETVDNSTRRYRDELLEITFRMPVPYYQGASPHALTADVVVANLTRRTVYYLKPEIMDKSSDTDPAYASNIVVYNEWGEQLHPTPLPHELWPLRRSEIPRTDERYSNQFHLEERFPDINKPGRYRVEFSYWDDRPGVDCWRGRVIMPPVYVVRTPAGFALTTGN